MKQSLVKANCCNRKVPHATAMEFCQAWNARRVEAIRVTSFGNRVLKKALYAHLKENQQEEGQADVGS